MFQLQPELSHRILVVLVGRSDEEVVGNVGRGGEVAELGRVVVAKLFGVDTFLGRSALDLHAVLVGAGAEVGFLAADLLPSLDHVGEDHAI